jgi:hypothetical protein
VNVRRREIKTCLYLQLLPLPERHKRYTLPWLEPWRWYVEWMRRHHPIFAAVPLVQASACLFLPNLNIHALLPFRCHASSISMLPIAVSSPLVLIYHNNITSIIRLLPSLLPWLWERARREVEWRASIPSHTAKGRRKSWLRKESRRLSCSLIMCMPFLNQK